MDSDRLAGRGAPLAATVAALLMAAMAARVMLGWICAVGRPWSWDYGPTVMALGVGRLLQGGNLYVDFIRNPLGGSGLLYNPLAPYLAAALAGLFGHSPFAALEAGRALTICATAGVCVLIFVLARRMGACRGVAIIAALAFALSPLLEPWGFEFRPDMPALAATMLGLYLFDRGMAGAAVSLFVIGFLFKQSSVAGIGAAALFTWLNSEPLRAIKLGLSWLAPVLVAIGSLVALFPSYWLNTVTAMAPQTDFGALPGLIGYVLFFDFAIFALAAIGLLRKGPRHSLARCFLIAAFAQDLAGSIRWGSNVYYFLPTLAAAAIVAATELNVLFDRTRALRAGWQVVAGVVTAGVVVYQLALGTSGGGAYGVTRFREVFGIGDFACPLPAPYTAEALQRLKLLRGPVLTGDPSLALTDPAHVHFIDFMVLAAMRSKRLYNDQPLMEGIKQRRFAAIALDDELLQRQWQGRLLMWPALREAIAANYSPVPEPGPPFLMVPREYPATGRAARPNSGAISFAPKPQGRYRGAGDR